jgi:predicted ATPase
MLFAIAGSQGSGKSTTLNALREKGYMSIERKTSRSVLQEWNTTLDEVYSNCEMTIRFQSEILNRKIRDEQHAVDHDEPWITERTYADLFAYTVLVLGKFNQYSSFVDEYFETCKAHQPFYERIFYLKAGHFKPEHDGVRGSNMHYAHLMDTTMLDITQRMCDPAIPQLVPIDLKSVDERANLIQTRIERAKTCTKLR